MTIKLADYERMGVSSIRVVDPDSQSISRFQNGTLTPIEAAVEPIPDIACILDWNRIKELLDF
jgi:hypothetical protein